MNTKIGGIIYRDVAFLLAVISFDYKLVCKFYTCLS